MCVCPQDLRNGTSSCHTPFTRAMNFSWWFAKTAWWILYSNTKWWMHHLPFPWVSAYNVPPITLAVPATRNSELFKQLLEPWSAFASTVLEFWDDFVGSWRWVTSLCGKGNALHLPSKPNRSICEWVMPTFFWWYTIDKALLCMSNFNAKPSHLVTGYF